jgi:conjugative transfer signal peptidase TraF
MVENERRAILRIGDAIRRDRTRRSQLRGRGYAVAALIGAVGLTVVVPLRPMLVWNASASAPIGLYGVTAPHGLRVRDMVIAHLPAAWRGLADTRRYLPSTVPLVKRVAAAPGDTVCAAGQEIFVNGRWVAARRIADGAGRPMPSWTGCATLRDGALFLMTDNPDSFDGRYFGPTSHADIVGKAHLLWRR